MLTLVVWAVVALIAFYVAFVPFARLVSAPFMAFFSEKVFTGVSGLPALKIPGSRFMRWIVRPIRDSVVLLFIRAIVTIFALPLLFVPIVGQVAYVLLMGPIEAMDLLDWAQGARAKPIGERLPFIKRNLSACMGLGTGSAMFLLVPVLNAFVLPALVVGAVLLDQELSPDFPTAPAPVPDEGAEEDV